MLQRLLNDAVAKLTDARGRGAESAQELISRADACNYLKVSLPTLHRFINDGLIEPVKCGRRTLIDLAEIRRKAADGTLSKYSRR